MCVFDLDPGPPATIVECARVGMWLREVLEGLGLEAWAKTSGSKGLQLYVPLNQRVTYDDTKPFAHALAQLLENQHPELVVSVMAKERRKGKVFIDWSQNDPHKTTVCVYSLRARPRPTVSTPVTWDEVEHAAAGDTSLLDLDAPAVLERVPADGDLFAPVLDKRQKLPKPPTP
jgi:bifunctional non-homologous end joining protein LigD